MPNQQNSIFRRVPDYKNLHLYQKSEVLVVLTARFCQRFLPPYGDRTVDQMNQAARSGKQNIVEGSEAAMTSSETEVKLVNVGRASLQELREDYEDYLKKHSLPIWDRKHPRFEKMLAFYRTHNSLDDYWFSSGTPSYLMRLLSKCNENVMEYTGRYYDRKVFVDYKADTAMPLPMIFQSGYLTIKDVDREFNTYLLDFPNAEVREGLATLLMGNYLQPKEDAKSWVANVVRALRTADLDQVRRLFTSFLAGTPYSMRPKKTQEQREQYFHYTFYLLMRLISCYTVYTEKQLSEGRADCIVETPQYIYIFEFKLDGTAQEALRQIKDKGYAAAYAADPRPLFRVGASFSSKTGTVEEWQTE